MRACGRASGKRGADGQASRAQEGKAQCRRRVFGCFSHAAARAGHRVGEISARWIALRKDHTETVSFWPPETPQRRCGPRFKVPSAAADVAASGTRFLLASRQHPWPVPSRLPGACQLPWSAWRGAHATHSSPPSPVQQVHRWQGAPQAAGHQGRSQERAGHWRREEGAHTGLRWADGATRGRALPDPRFERAARELAQPPHAYRTP